MEGFNDDSVNLFGKKASDLQSNATVSNNTFSATLKDIDTTDAFYTTAGFDSSLGTHFLVVKATPKTSGDTISFTFNGTTKNLDSDGILVLQMTEEKKSMSIEFVEKSGATTVDTYTLALTGCTLE